jgi:hypothetical protein
MLIDFSAQNPDILDTSILQKFCEYAKTWLLEKGVIGVAQTSDGFALRFSNGDERLFFSSGFKSIADQPSFSLSGGAGGPVRVSAPTVDTSFKITG